MKQHDTYISYHHIPVYPEDHPHVLSGDFAASLGVTIGQR